MGYTENCLPRALAARGHEVHVITSTFNVYGNQADYAKTYQAFLGPNVVTAGTTSVDGYQVHRLNARVVGAYVMSAGLAAMVRKIAPDVVHSLEIASLQTYELALQKPFAGYALFCETHQHMSVVKPFLKRSGALFQKAVYRMTRTLPTHLASLAVEKCYAISPDCVLVAKHYYGVPNRKLSLRPLGTDTSLFHPAATPEEIARRVRVRSDWGYTPDDILCIYAGRFSAAKNPLVLARAVETLAESRLPYQSLFVGEGSQKEAIARCRNARVLPFARYRELADLYQMADIAVWPRQESMSMLDAAATGMPLVVSDEIGESDRVVGNGRVYKENDVEDLARVLSSLADAGERRKLGAAGRAKMAKSFSWAAIAESMEADFASVRGSSRNE